MVGGIPFQVWIMGLGYPIQGQDDGQWGYPIQGLEDGGVAPSQVWIVGGTPGLDGVEGGTIGMDGGGLPPPPTIRQNSTGSTYYLAGSMPLALILKINLQNKYITA